MGMIGSLQCFCCCCPWLKGRDNRSVRDQLLSPGEADDNVRQRESASSTSSDRSVTEEVVSGYLINEAKGIEGISLQYLSQIREILAIHSFILEVLKAMKNSSPEETAQTVLTSVIDVIEEFYNDDITKAHYTRITEDMTKCYCARKRTERPSSSQAELLQEMELTDWGVTLDETIGENFQLCPNNQGDEIGSAIEECIKYIFKESKSTLGQLQAMRSADFESRETVIQLLSRLAGWCEQFCGTCEFMKTCASIEDRGKAERSMGSIQTWQKNLEKACQRVELSCPPDMARRYSSTIRNQVLSEKVGNFLATQQEHVDLLKRWRNYFSFLCERIRSIGSSSKGLDCMVFQAERMQKRIRQHIRQTSPVEDV